MSWPSSAHKIRMADYTLTPRGPLKLRAAGIDRALPETSSTHTDKKHLQKSASATFRRSGNVCCTRVPSWKASSGAKCSACYRDFLYNVRINSITTRVFQEVATRARYVIGTLRPCVHTPKVLKENRPQRLIHTGSLKLVDFEDETLVPRYAILSHTWGLQEVDIREFSQHQKPTETSTKSGYQKIRNACKQARFRGLEYLWVDTCCIDQRDKRDVHRNVKSMYAYYQNSSICFAYLSDIRACGSITRSRWFSRGWTLQELLAPPEVVFFDRFWMPLGTRTGYSDQISDETGIPKELFQGGMCLHDVSVEQRMSWAMARTTTRPQDQAYCLIGILGIALEPDYDEIVYSAFFRLRQAFFEQYPDQAHSFFKHWGKHGRDVFDLLMQIAVQRVLRTSLGPSQSVDNWRISRPDWQVAVVEPDFPAQNKTEQNVLNELLSLLP